MPKICAALNKEKGKFKIRFPASNEYLTFAKEHYIIITKKGVFTILLEIGDSMEIRRDMYLNRLIRKEKNGLIKVVTGIRRCGKSYLLLICSTITL